MSDAEPCPSVWERLHPDENRPLFHKIPNWKEFLRLLPEEEVDLIHRHERTGHPLGTPSFIENIEQVLQRTLRPQKPGPKKKIF